MKVKQSPYYKGPLAFIKKKLADQYSLHLFLTTEKEVIGINAVGDGATNERHPMKHHGGLAGVFEQQLAENVEHNGKHKE